MLLLYATNRRSQNGPPQFYLFVDQFAQSRPNLGINIID